MIKLEDIRSLTEFQRDTKTLMKRLRKTGRPLVLTLNGKAVLVVQDASSYQAMLDAIEHAEAIAGIQRGLDSVQRGEGEAADTLFARLRKRHNIAAE